MDKPLSQEQLSEDEMGSAQHYLEYGFDSTFAKVYGAKLINEVKRLQAIEAERDQYKLALEKLDAVFDFSDKIRTNEEIFIDDPAEINEALDFAYSLINPEQHAINKALEGADTNE